MAFDPAEGGQPSGEEPSTASRGRPPRPGVPMVRSSSQRADAAHKEHRFYSYDAFLGRDGNSRPGSARRGWSVGSSVPRSFDEISSKQPADALPLKYGPKEEDYRQIGERLTAQAHEAAVQESIQARDGKVRRGNAEAVCRSQHHKDSGEPWRACRYGNRRGGPKHLPGNRYKGGPIRASSSGSGLFSEVPLLETSESAARIRDARESELPKRRLSRPSSAPPRRACAH
eukprot:TRINITY_DN26980_c0_g1_i1.p1 TRINITY_DN26980_c0_g1~~TRINITY_DN26980_c0_g1_i1.p1  ORF type:complete len:229 (+),score=26.21 TRINITY_DN26980_c0_g1_i1:186-872(+)